MSDVVAIAQQPVLWRRSAPLATGAALAVSGAYVMLNDPSAAGSRFPACAFHRLTGLWCPGCGLTRGTHQLLNGHLGAALSYNVFTPLVMAAIVATWFVWLRTSWGRPTRPLIDRLPQWWGGALGVALVVYGVLRNLPVAPLRTLAP